MAFDLDPEELEAFRNGNPQLWLVVDRTFRNPIFAVSFKILNNREDAEEVTSDTLTELFKARTKFGSWEHVRNFLFQVVRNKSINRLKANDLRNNFESPVDPDYLNDSVADDTALRLDILKAEIIESLWKTQAYKAMATLPPKRRTAFRLYYFEHKSVEDIANYMGISESTVYTHLRKAKKAILASLKQQGFDPRLLLLWLLFLF